MANADSAAVLPIAGKRTGVQIFPSQGPSQDDVDELEQLFGTAQSPELTEPLAAIDSEQRKENNSNQEKTKKNLRFSVAPDDINHNDSEEEEVEDEHADRVGDAKMAARSLVSKTRQLLARGSMSPSELSTVSTAPPSEARTIGMMDEPRSGASVTQTPEASVATPMALDLDHDNDEDVGGQMDESSAASPAVGQQDDPDDLLPPAPPPMDEEEDDDVDDAIPAHAPSPAPLDDDNDDDDDGGVGYNMAQTPNRPGTPSSDETVEEEIVSKKRKGVAKKAKKMAAKPAEDESTVQTAPPKKKQKTKAKSVTFSPKGMQTGPREYKAILVSDLKNESPSDKNLRRSKRAHIEPLKYWLGEKVEYGPNDFGDAFDSLAYMSVPVAVNRAEPTPRKRRKVTESAVNASSKIKRKKGDKKEPALKRFDAKKLPPKYKYQESDEAYLWDEDIGDSMDAKVIAYGQSMDLRELPPMKRKRNENKGLGLAGQAFNVKSDGLPSYIMGKLILPTESVKDPEGVGACAQTFTVVTGQPGALEVAYGDPGSCKKGIVVAETAQRYLLSPGDMFRIPPGNYYRLENHSNTTECMLTWTIIRPPEDYEEGE